MTPLPDALTAEAVAVLEFSRQRFTLEWTYIHAESSKPIDLFEKDLPRSLCAQSSEYRASDIK